jgi:hypothetical protein
VATQVTVNITMKEADGGNLSGTLTFRPSSPFYDSASDMVIGTAPVTVTLASGAASVILYATDDSTTTAADPTYTVTEDLTGGDGNPRKRKHKISLPAAVTPVRYEDLS